jgi:hypothetical protein
MTEKEARVKWCPLTVFQAFCRASNCMMWRWRRHDYADGYQPQEGHDEYDKGYCGLGGRA